MERYSITGIILSGGKSTRMGKTKALLEVDGLPIIERIYRVFRDCFQEILIISDQRDLFSNLEVTVYGDLIPDRGALGGLYTGLFFASFQYSFCVACDMPFLKRSLIEYLIGRIDGFDSVVPRTKDGLQPLHAIYSKACLEPIKGLMQQGKSKIIDFYSRIHVRYLEEDEFHFLDPENESFINVNTPEELAALPMKGGVH